MPNPFDLTMRERQVMELVCEGADYPTIAQRLAISPRCARRRFETAVDKIGVKETASINRRSIAAAIRFDRAMRATQEAKNV